MSCVTTQLQIMELKGVVQAYAWGKLGKSSKVALLYSYNDPQFTIEESPYAELWMGTHCNGPSTLKKTDQELQEWIVTNENCLGDEVIKKFGKELPFLFKVLAVNKALSIQAHPSKSHAEELHKLQPDIYKDPNHKPELAIALTQFEALCGFRPTAEIQKFLQDVPQLQTVIGQDKVSLFLETNDVTGEKHMLKECFSQLMKCPNEVVAEQLMSLISDLEKVSLSSNLKKLITTLHSEYPGDVGCFCVFFMNHVILNPGESIYLGPNVPHAYLFGDCVECMACSDNVVRAGLTPKFRDVETLCEMLLYDSMPAASVKFQPVSEDAFTVVFRPPVPDFAVANIVIPEQAATYTTIPRNSASIILVVEGEGHSCAAKLKPGTILFVPAKVRFTIKSEKKLNIYQAFANV